MKRLLLFILFILVTQIYSQENSWFARVDFPEYIPINNEFEISITNRFFDKEIEKVVFYISYSGRMKIGDISLFSSNQKIKLQAFPSRNSKKFQNLYKIVVDSSLVSEVRTSFYQIVINRLNKSDEPPEFDFYIETLNSKNLVNKYNSESLDRGIVYSKKPEVKTYIPQVTATNALKLKENARFDLFPRSDSEYPVMELEFWLKMNNRDQNFLKIVDVRDSDTLLTLGLNKFKMLSAMDDLDIFYFGDYFVGTNSWNYISILFNRETDQLSAYVNDDSLFSKDIIDFPDFTDLLFSFFNEEAGEDIFLDRIKIWQGKMNIKSSQENKNFKTYSREDSKLVVDYNFDEPLVNEETDGYGTAKMERVNTELVVSDSPIFSSQPSLNISLYNDFFTLDWTSSDPDNAVEFVLEKSFSGRDYTVIYNCYADTDPSRIYVYTDERNKSSDILFYRIKQINKDGSGIYSSTIKIGQGQKDIFYLKQNYPNPFNPITSLIIEMFESGHMEINIYDLVGVKIQNIHSGILPEGIHTYRFDGTNLPSGIYFYEAKSENSTQIKKMILAK